MPESGSALKDGKAAVTKAGTRQALPSLGSSAGSARSVVVQALSTNEGKIAVGGSTVVAAPGTHAAPTQSGILLNAGDTAAFDVTDTAQIYLDATVTGDGVGYTVLTA